jgi:DNA invertase Pin-like site-specific DNA recombinase
MDTERSSMSTKACATTLPQPTAVIFLREQGEQYESCEHAAKALGAQVIRKYAQHDGTGSIMRPTLRHMLDELLALRDAQYVIVTSPDRLTRRADVMATILQEIQTAGAELAIAAIQTDTGIIKPLSQ